MKKGKLGSAGREAGVEWAGGAGQSLGGATGHWRLHRVWELSGGVSLLGLGTPFFPCSLLEQQLCQRCPTPAHLVFCVAGPHSKGAEDSHPTAGHVLGPTHASFR